MYRLLIFYKIYLQICSLIPLSYLEIICNVPYKFTEKKVINHLFNKFQNKTLFNDNSNIV